MLVAVAVTVPAVLAAQLLVSWRTDTRIAVLPAVLLSWSLTSALYVGVTLRVFWGADASRLRRLAPPTRPGSRAGRWLRGGDDGPGLAVQFAVVALATAVLLPRAEQLAVEGQQLLLTVLSVVSVILGWVVVGVSYAVYYSRLQVRDNGLALPGSDEPGFTDYVYVAVSVLTTLGTSDVATRTTTTRRAVMGQSLLAFLFNSVILVLLIGALVG